MGIWEFFGHWSLEIGHSLHGMLSFVLGKIVHRLHVALLIVVLINPSAAFADTQQTPDYTIPADAVVVGGAEKGVSAKYLLDDSVGEPIIGPGTSAEYTLESGYRQPLASSGSISLNCSTSVTLPAILATGQSTGSGTCVVTSDAVGGYALSWGVLTGSGGTNTGSLIASGGNTIAPYTPVAGGVPETWSVATSAAEWGARLKSVSTDADVKWGLENGTDKWINIPASSSSEIVSRTSATDPGGSTEIIQFRTEIGTGVLQVNGVYEATVTFTVVAL